MPVIEDDIVDERLRDDVDDADDDDDDEVEDELTVLEIPLKQRVISAAARFEKLVISADILPILD